LTLWINVTVLAKLLEIAEQLQFQSSLL